MLYKAIGCWLETFLYLSIFFPICVFYKHRFKRSFFRFCSRHCKKIRNANNDLYIESTELSILILSPFKIASNNMQNAQIVSCVEFKADRNSYQFENLSLLCVTIIKNRLYGLNTCSHKLKAFRRPPIANSSRVNTKSISV